MFEFKIKGFEELERQFERLKRNARSIGGKHQVPLSDLLNPIFLQQHTKFRTIDDLFDASPFQVETQEDFEAIDQRPLDDFIRASTKFESWQKMLDHAAEEWAEAELFKGIR